jgi:hypothetical protein
MASDMNFRRGAPVHSNVFGDQLALREPLLAGFRGSASQIVDIDPQNGDENDEQT